MSADPSKFKMLLAGLATICMGYVPYWLQPQMVYEFVELKHMGEARAGLIAALEMLTVALSAMLLVRIAARATLRGIAFLGISAVILATVLGMVVSDWIALLLTRLFAGFGEGALLTVATATIARLEDPDSSYGKSTTANMVFGTVVLLAIPVSQPLIGSALAFPLCIAAVVLLAPAAFLIPRAMRLGRGADGISQLTVDPLERDVYSTPILLLTFALFGTFLANGITWTFAVQLGLRAGISAERTNTILATASFVAITGSLLATFVSTRFGRLIPVTSGLVLVIGSVLAICFAPSPWLFACAFCILFSATIFVLTYVLGAAADVDPSGRGAAVVNTGYVLASAAGAYLGGIVIASLGVKALTLILPPIVFAAWLCFVIANSMSAQYATAQRLDTP